MARNILNIIGVVVSLITLITAASIPADLTAASYAPHTEYEGVGFKGTIHGVEVELNGTLESIYAQFTALHPDIVAEHNTNYPAVGTIENYYLFHPVNNSALDTRGTMNKIQPPACCPVAGWGWNEAQVRKIQQGISYLDNIGGVLHLPAMSRGRISCSYSSAIYANNDNNYDIWPNTVYVASYAQDLINFCQIYDKGTALWWVCGQEFDTDLYNIVVRYDDTNHCG